MGFPYARRFLTESGDSPVSLAGGQILVGSIEAGILAILFTGPPAEVRSDGIVSLLLLGALGTGVAYILSYSILRDAGATVVSSVTYLLPVVAVVAGVVLLGERLEWNQPVGAVVVALGALIAQERVGRSWLRARRVRTAGADP